MHDVCLNRLGVRSAFRTEDRSEVAIFPHDAAHISSPTNRLVSTDRFFGEVRSYADGQLDDLILRALRRHGQVVAAAREPRCSQAHIHKRMKEAGITLGEVLAIQDPED